MILSRLGNKRKIAKKIIPHFPPHKIYIEPFFGAGGIFFNKEKASNNILNDLDGDVFNLFMVVMNQKEELFDLVDIMPMSSDLLDYWAKNTETDPIKKAVRFIMLSNFTLYGTGTSFKFATTRKEYLFNFKETLKNTQNFLKGCQFSNFDFRKLFTSINFPKDGRNDEAKTFIYCDPPYIGTTDNYDTNAFTEQDSTDLFDCLEQTKCKYAVSEFDNEFILEQAKQRGLNVVVIGERQNLKNRRTEILITNYKKSETLF